jgi:hypothetical protein
MFPARSKNKSINEEIWLLTPVILQAFVFDVVARVKIKLMKSFSAML